MNELHQDCVRAIFRGHDRRIKAPKPKLGKLPISGPRGWTGLPHVVDVDNFKPKPSRRAPASPAAILPRTGRKLFTKREAKYVHPASNRFARQ
jgi:hypothetical protein